MELFEFTFIEFILGLIVINVVIGAYVFLFKSPATGQQHVQGNWSDAERRPLHQDDGVSDVTYFDAHGNQHHRDISGQLRDTLGRKSD